ncbi:MAG: NAD(+)/NADH kinase [Exilispira sp.]
MAEKNKIAFFIYEKDNQSNHLLSKLKNFLKNIQDVEANFFLLKRDNVGFHFINKKPEKGENYKLAISIGGDGTFLFTVSYFYGTNTPFLPINNGRLGFLAWNYFEELNDQLTNFLSGNYKEDKRILLKTNVELDNLDENKKAEFYSLNEIAISKFEFSTPLEVLVKLDGEKLLHYWGDGIIVATPTGSTGYSLSAGGPIICPTLDSIIITPICPHSFTVKPIVVKSDHEICITVLNKRKITITADGQRGISFIGGLRHSIIVKKAEKPITIVRVKKVTFFDIISKKLGWGL